MGLEMELDFHKSCKVGLSPNTVLPSHQDCSNVEKRNLKGKSTCKDESLSLKKDFIEINLSRFCSSSCKSIQNRPVGLEGNIELERGSMYQSSREVRKMKKSTVGGGRNIEICRSSDTSLSFRIVDSLCGFDEEGRSPVVALDSNFSPTSVCRPYAEPCSSDSFHEICLNLNSRDNPADTLGKDSVYQNFRSDEAVGPLMDSNELLERERVHSLHKSLSAKVEMPHSHSPSHSDYSSRVSSNTRFSPIRNLFDPFKKSKSLRSPLGYIVEPGGLKASGTTNMRSKTCRKSLLHDFSNAAKVSRVDPQFVGRENHHSVVACSPVHLHGYLKLKYKHGVPLFEFSLKSPEDVFVAKVWKTDNAFQWVYTFHSLNSRKKSNASGRGWNGGDRDSSMVGQMQVACYLCSELKDTGVFVNSVVTEFVLYDIVHARQNVAAQENGTPDAVKFLKGSNPGLAKETFENDRSHSMKVKLKQRQSSEKGDFNSSNSYPWASAELHPNLEIAAIVMQVPFEKRESLRYKRDDKISDELIPSLHNHSMIEQTKEDLHYSRSPEKLKVLIPNGNHGFPSAESRGPSSLLDRWRLGGGCDCGGWDMGCPLTVLGNPCIQCAEDQPLDKHQQPLELFVQGAKDSTPSLTMTVVEEGEYAVDFHAQLSTLQAFSVCVAILHGTEASIDARKDRNKQLSQNNSLKVLIDEEVKFLIEAVTTGEKTKVTKMVKEIPPSYVINPPFSPIARV
ncbi:hypothetical protein I3843_11G131600 [Carya illinoinensis]|nr:hypothetical protein I3760_11G131500 [Carya illinoinensis]KAG2681160.1 hypothetical protein I3760_11G131500 [Carya illinoinensis]KAG2681163.1 hypothetical protein I3760_11G131500 [Carya illinoinensis]KAG2681164.1 hypothetical protein I3760_11G131500 [Carya illinoinensis]KAG7956597.1 hypothetical protein I3843_11G131600 [Carya illinoinensis]